MDDKRNIISISIKLNWFRNFESKFNIEPKKIKILAININPPNVLNVNFDKFDGFLNVS